MLLLLLEFLNTNGRMATQIKQEQGNYLRPQKRELHVNATRLLSSPLN